MISNKEITNKDMTNKTKKQNRYNLFQNKNKNKSSHPDFKGIITIDGKRFRVIAWENKDKNRNKYISLALSPLMQKNKTQHQRNTNTSNTITSNTIHRSSELASADPNPKEDYSPFN